MLPGTRWILSFSFLLLNLGCAQNQLKEINGPITQVFEANYEELWRAMQKAMIDYPIRINNADTGQFETEVVRPTKMWQPAHEKREYSPGMRYVIRLTAIRGVTGGDKDAVRLSIEKVITIERDFFAGAQRLPSDGLEETNIFYRIQREITLERSIRAAYEQGKL